MVLLEHKFGSKFMPIVAQEIIQLKVMFVVILGGKEIIHVENVWLVDHRKSRKLILDFTVFLK